MYLYLGLRIILSLIHIYQLIAGLAVACRYGFEIDDALGIAEKTYVNVNIHKKENEDKLKQQMCIRDRGNIMYFLTWSTSTDVPVL